MENFSARIPARSLLMSLFFTGLGQMYNGQFLKSFTLVLMRIFIFFSAVFSISNQNFAYYGIIFIFSIVFVFFLKMFSVLDAYFIAKKNSSFNLKKYNKNYFYALFSFLSAAFIILSTILFFTYYKPGKIANNSMLPLIKKGDIYLSILTRFDNLKTGDIVKDDDYFGRIVFKKNGIYEFKFSKIWINGLKLQLDVPEKINDSLYYIEINDEIKYPVYIDIEDEKVQKIFFKKQINDSQAVLLNDNRTQPDSKVIEKDYYYKITTLFISFKPVKILSSKFLL